jgi:AbrB family looped-hinge helix DNA binding protein
MTIPKEVRKALNLRPSEKVIIVVEGNRAILQPLKGNLLDIGGSVKSIHTMQISRRLKILRERGLSLFPRALFHGWLRFAVG